MSAFLSLFAVPSLISLGMLLYQSWFWTESGRWTEGDCLIDRAELVTNYGGDSDSYRLDVEYHYDFQGRVYQSKRV